MTNHPDDHEIGSSAGFELEKVFMWMDATVKASPPGWCSNCPKPLPTENAPVVVFRIRIGRSRQQLARRRDISLVGARTLDADELECACLLRVRKNYGHTAAITAG
jgi:hypothetical protein